MSRPHIIISFISIILNFNLIIDVFKIANLFFIGTLSSIQRCEF